VRVKLAEKLKDAANHFHQLFFGSRRFPTSDPNSIFRPLEITE